jgi:septal ring factor EnvC (AmiA/AmiB activator)
MEKCNELIKAINEKDELLEKQEDLLINEKEKNAKLKKSLALKKEELKILTKELKECCKTISNLKSQNVDLKGEITNLSVSQASTLNIDHVSICTKCRNIDIDALKANVTLIENLNAQVTKLKA